MASDSSRFAKTIGAAPSLPGPRSEPAVRLLWTLLASNRAYGPMRHFGPPCLSPK